VALKDGEQAACDLAELFYMNFEEAELVALRNGCQRLYRLHP
jgi:hypothetical protein